MSPKFVLIGTTIAALAPFLDKAFHIDDPLFLWMAEQISKQPGDPYGFAVNWTSSPQPMWMVMQNPPLCSYLIAAFAATLGRSEVALHLAFLLPAIAAVLGTFAIARRLCAQPVLAALLALFTPAFLVSATNLMCDVLLLACWVWSIELWLAGLDKNKRALLFGSALLAAAAVLTKYFGIALVPLLATYTLLRDRRLCQHLALFLLPVAVLITFEFWTRSEYGRALFTAAVTFARFTSSAHQHSLIAQLFTGVSFTGGCLFSALFFLREKSGRRLIGFLAIIVVMFVTIYFFAPPAGSLVSEHNRLAVSIEAAIFATIGIGVIALALADAALARTAESILVALWVIGTFCFATLCNWSITSRTILPMIPAVAILVIRRWPPTEGAFANPLLHYWPLLPAAFVSWLIAAADYRQANSAREAAYSFQQRFGAEKATVWFQSHWGFQYYMQGWGAKPWDASASEFASGDVMVVPQNSTPLIEIPSAKILTSEKVSFATLPLVTTFGRGTGACFYSSVRGPVPWAVDSVPPETYHVAHFR